jgi:transposase
VKKRKHHTPEEKVAILGRHLLENEPIAKLCDKLALKRTVFYRWQKEFLDSGGGSLRPEEANRPLRRAGAGRLP